MIQDAVKFKQLEECGATYRHFDISGQNIMCCEILDLASGKTLVCGKGASEATSFEDAFAKWNPSMTPITPAMAVSQLADKDKQIEELRRQLAGTQGASKEPPKQPK